MKLVLKLPKDKPPFIGIQFPNSYAASRTNEDLPGMLDKEDCRLILEPVDKHYLNLRLVNTDKLIDTAYKQVEYNIEKLKTWLNQTEKENQFNFAHVTLDYDKHVVAKVGGGFEKFVIRLNSVKIITEI